MKREPQRELVDRFFSGTGATYRRTATLGTLGFDLWWKRQIVAAVPPGASRILDQASGTGILTFRLGRRFPESLVIGVELRREYLAIAQGEKERLRADNVHFVQGRAEDVAVRPPLDCITSSYLAKYADLDGLIANARGMLRPGGVVLLHDFTYPTRPLLAKVWEAYLGLLGAVWGRAHPEWREALGGLPALVRQTDWAAGAVRALARYGFGGITVRRLTLGAAALVSARLGSSPLPGRGG
jgi:demethylmenaquinone methyltransferase / 2-methoxy-6-polyprenyl-1,4-benzoquinol methylase